MENTTEDYEITISPINGHSTIYRRLFYEGGYLKRVVVGLTPEERKLASAAPELLEALKLAYNLLEEHQCEAKWYLRGHYNKITTAIKKATE